MRRESTPPWYYFNFWFQFCLMTCIHDFFSYLVICATNPLLVSPPPFFFIKFIWIEVLSLSWYCILGVSSHFIVNRLNTKIHHFLCQAGPLLAFPFPMICATISPVMPVRNSGVILASRPFHFPHLAAIAASPIYYFLQGSRLSLSLHFYWHRVSQPLDCIVGVAK